MEPIRQSERMRNVRYEIRGAVAEEAYRMEHRGEDVIKLNIGNPPAFGIDAPDEVLEDMIFNLKNALPYSESRGIFPARKAVMQYYQLMGHANLDINDIFLGNGASDLIIMAMSALLNAGDEVLVPAPDYPLWTASVNLSEGKAVHYICDESADWVPDIEDMKKKITKKTRAIVVINPNNPTGAVYPKEILEDIAKLAREHGLIIFADEMYDHLIMDGHRHISIGSVARDVFCATLGGLSKSHRVTGFRAGWIVFSGGKERGRDFINGFNVLASMRLCPNVPAQYAIQTALGGYQSIDELTSPGGRLYEQREITWRELNNIPGISCVKPKAGLYAFPKVDIKKFNITNDEKMALDMLKRTRVLIVQGSGFNWPEPDHFRIVFLPDVSMLHTAYSRMRRFFSEYIQTP